MDMLPRSSAESQPQIPFPKATSQPVMRDLVILNDGITYERRAIEEWLQRNGTNPITHERIPRDANSRYRLVPNYALRNMIETLQIS